MKLEDTIYTVFDKFGLLFFSKYGLWKRIQQLSAKEIEFLREETKPVILKFYANWCSPCKRLAPIIEAVNEHFGGRIIIINFIVDQYDTLCKQLNVIYLPTLFYFKADKEIQQTSS